MTLGEPELWESGLMRTLLGVLIGAVGVALAVAGVWLWANRLPFFAIPVGGVGASLVWAVIDNGFVYKSRPAAPADGAPPPAI